MLDVTAAVPVAAWCTACTISPVAAPCSSTAAEIPAAVSLICPIVPEIPPIAATA